MTDSVDGERAWLERELSELRAREAQYRERLGKKETLGARLHAYAESLHQLFRRRPPTRVDLARTLVDVARLSGQALNIERPSVWLFDATGEELQCIVQLDAGKDVVVDGIGLKTADCPAYVKALSEESAVAVSNVLEDPRTRELVPYMREHAVGALLDIPIVVPGSLLGVVCHEHVNGPRTWQREEIEFASNVGHVVALALEAERRSAAEYAARGSEAKYRHLVESLPVTVYSFDTRTGKLEYVSPRATEFGTTAAEMLKLGADGWIERIHPEDRGPVLARFQGGVSGGLPDEVTYRVRMPDGSTRWVRDTCSVVRDPLGKPIAIQGVVSDVTAQAEAALSRVEFERRYRSLLENVDLHAVTLDLEGRATFVNDAFIETSGYSRDELIGKDWFSMMIAPPQQVEVRKRFLDDVGNRTVVPRFELGIVTRTGDSRHLLCTNTILKTPEGTVSGTATLALDVTDRRRLETELLQQTKVESLGRLAASVAHDFNNLLMVVMAEVSMLERDRATEADTTRFRSIDAALEQAADLTRSLLTYGRKQPIVHHRIVVDELVSAAMPLVEAIAGRSLHVKASLHADGALVRVDDVRLRQVVLNLVGNAADATRSHGSFVYLATHVELLEEALARRNGATPGREFVVVTISDDGRGMDARTLSRIFEPFFTTKQDGRGTGLGLAITQTVVTQAGGFVTVESSVGVGTTFRLYLPVADAAPPSLARISRVAPRTGKKRVLVVDDELAIRDFVAARLEGAGYEVVTAATTRSAAEALGAEPFDLLVTDVSLLDGSGTVLARSARAVRPHLPVILMTGSDEPDDAFDALLTKPFDERALVEAIAKAFVAHDVKLAQ
ncbi:MAG TPA: PAS domain S-box protein [Polyangiaceae bacterium]|jgi:PAS domain S-box-containing protein|nr:PAS domain S-box protein [Polyangiaceae bacterium]